MGEVGLGFAALLCVPGGALSAVLSVSPGRHNLVVSLVFEDPLQS